LHNCKNGLEDKRRVMLDRAKVIEMGRSYVAGWETGIFDMFDEGFDTSIGSGSYCCYAFTPSQVNQHEKLRSQADGEEWLQAKS
jgi:hypothetical protein